MTEPKVQRVSARTLEPDGVELRRIRAAVTGQDAALSRSRAMALLQRSGFPDRHRDFGRVLEDDTQPPVARYLAATHLRRVGTPAAMQILIRNSDIGDDWVLAGVMSALGRIGDASAIDAVRKVARRAEGAASSRARFAATLIAHRLRIDCSEYPLSDTEDYVEFDLQGGRPLHARRVDEEDAAVCVSALADEPFGIEFAEHTITQLSCGPNTWMVALNQEFNDKTGVASLTSKEGFLGVVAIRGEQARSCSVSYLMLTSPAKSEDAVDVVIYTTSGQPCFRGTGRVVRDEVQFSVRALARPGALGVTIAGTLRDGTLGIVTALSTPFIQLKKLEPIEERAQSSSFA